MNRTNRKTIEGWIDKAANHLEVAKQHAKSLYRSSEAIEAAQVCVELSAKAILSLLNIKYPPSHEWAAEGKMFAPLRTRFKNATYLTSSRRKTLTTQCS